MVSNNQFFVIGSASASSNNLNLYKITFSSTSVHWADQITCSGTWSGSFSESLLSSDQSTIYSFFLFGPPSTYYLYFAGLSVTDGSVVTTRYKSSTTASNVWGSALNGDYVVAQRIRLIRIIEYTKAKYQLTNNICKRANISQIGKAVYN